MATLVDTNVLLDLATEDPTWAAWSMSKFIDATLRGPVFINPIIYAELAPAFETAEQLDRWISPKTLRRVPLPYEAAWLASQAFKRYRFAGGTRTAPLPDFFIGAHAAVENLTLLTRDGARYKTYFPNVALITP